MRKMSTLILVITGFLGFVLHGIVLADGTTIPSGRASEQILAGEQADAPGVSATLCEQEEIVVFSCALPKKKIVSLCASKEASSNTGYMQYRFGRDISSIELEYPQKGKTPPREFFKHYSFAFPKGGTAAISFRIGTFRYSLFRTSSAFGYNGAGVIVNRGENAIRVSFLKCTDAPIKSPDVAWITPFATNRPISIFERLGLPAAGNDIGYIGPEPGSDLDQPKVGEPEDHRLRAKQITPQ